MRRLKEFLKQLKAESAKQQYPPFGDTRVGALSAQ